MGKIQYLDEISKTIKTRNKRVNIKNDDAYIQSLIKSQLESAIETYLVNGEDNSRKKMVIEISSNYIDNFFDFIGNDPIANSLIIKQIQPTLFELELKDLNLFI